MSKLIELAGAKLAQSDREKAMAALTEQVADNKQECSNEVYAAGKAVTSAEKRVTALDSDPTASLADIIDAEDALKVAKANVAQMEAIIARRF